MQIVHVDIRKVWDFIKPGLEVIQSISKPEWRVEDIYADCKYGKAFLFVDSSDYNSFVVLQSYECTSRGDHVLFVLAAYSPHYDAYMESKDEVERIARETGCRWIEFASPRRGWEKKAVDFDTVCVLYRKALA